VIDFAVLDKYERCFSLEYQLLKPLLPPGQGHT